MKKLILCISLILFTYNVKGQMAVVDAASAAQLATLNTTLQSVNASTLQQQASSASIDLLTSQGFDIAKIAEDALWYVSSYLKTGQEINSILKQEETLIKNIQKLRTVSVSFSNQGSVSNITGQYLNTAGNLVDLALQLLTDEKYRMDDNARRQYLGEISSKLTYLNSQLTRSISTFNNLKIQRQSSIDRKNSLDEAIKRTNKMAGK